MTQPLPPLMDSKKAPNTNSVLGPSTKQDLVNPARQPSPSSRSLDSVNLFFCLVLFFPGVSRHLIRDLILIFNPVKPFIIGEPLKSLVIKKGQIIKFDVKYGGEPEPEATWELEGKEIKIDGER